VKILAEVFPMTFEGAKFMVNKGISQHFQISHTVNISSANPAQSGYKFGANYVGTQQISPSEAFPILAGDIDPSGTMNANIIHLLQPRLLGRFVSKVFPEKTKDTGTAIQIFHDKLLYFDNLKCQESMHYTNKYNLYKSY